MRIRNFEPDQIDPCLSAQVSAAIKEVCESGNFFFGEKTEMFEAAFAEYTGSKFCIAASSGTMSLYLSLKALGIGYGSRVATVSNTCSPAVSAILATGAEPVFVEVEPTSLMMDGVDLANQFSAGDISALMLVHLWGHTCDLRELQKLANQYKVPVIEDCAQALGSRYAGFPVGSASDVGCYSFYPTKALASFGDAGAIVTNNQDIAQNLRSLRFYGFNADRVSLTLGFNGRMSEVQAAFLSSKLGALDEKLRKKRILAKCYDDNLRTECLQIIPNIVGGQSSYHQYVIRIKDRDSLQKFLMERGIETNIHYATPVHRMPAFSPFSRELVETELAADQILSLPIHTGLSEEEVFYVAKTVNEFTERFVGQD